MKSFSDFLDELGRSRVTGWRWVQRDWIKPIRIAGRLYITDHELQRFIERAERGELAQVANPLIDGSLTPRSDAEAGQQEGGE